MSSRAQRATALVAAALAAFLASAGAAAAEDPLATARRELDAGRFDDAYFALEHADASPAAEVAALLATAGEKLFAKGDVDLAELSCERALKRDPKNAKALSVCARACLHRGRPDDAEAYTDRLGALAPQDGEVALLRATIAAGLGDSAKVVKVLTPWERVPAFEKRAKPLLQSARADLASVDRLRGLQGRLEQAIEAALKVGPPPGPAPAGGDGEVVLYGASWCGSCVRAREWLTAKKVAFRYADVEDGEAAREVAEKCARAGERSGSIPVLDARGKIVVGFSPRTYEKLLRLH